MAYITQYRGKTWRAMVRRKGYPSQSKTFGTKREAESWAALVESRMGVSEYDRHQVKQAKLTTVEVLFERYIAEVAPLKRGRNEIGTLTRLMRDAAFMSVRADRITPKDIRDWRDDRLTQVSAASVHRELNTISAVLTHSIKEWGIAMPSNPCHSVSRIKGADKPRNTVWTDADVQTFLAAAGHDPDVTPKGGREYVGWALLLALETAMRIGEICTAMVADFHPREQYLHLRITKNGDSRNVPLSTKAVAYLQHLTAGKKPTDKIFPINANTLGEYFLDVRKQCGLEHLVFHDSRRTAATNISTKLSNVLELAQVTGHKSLKMLNRYYNPTPKSIADKLG